MEAHPVLTKHRLVYSASSAAIGACSLISTFTSDLYSRPAQVVLISTALCMWSLAIGVFSQISRTTVGRGVAIVLIAATILSCLSASSTEQSSSAIALTMICTALAIAVCALERDQRFSWISAGCLTLFLATGLVISDHVSQNAIVSFICVALVIGEFTLIRHVYVPVATSLTEALERADIFSTITRSSREFHSREPEEAIRNIVNVTKSLGYISVSVVSFDRRQKIFEDGVPIPNVMDIAVRASATRRVTITRDDKSRNPRMRDGDIVGVPIWINGRYSAALIVQTLANVKVTQRDSEALELLADQAGRALENAGKAAMDRRVVERLTDESQRDKLTGLGNRRFADSMVASMKPGDVLAMIDLDGLKNTNDVYGHASGDQLLHEVGVFLSEQIRNPDMASRLGGDEFMVLLRNADASAEKILERIRQLWQERKLFDTTFSIGMAQHTAERTPRETVEAADAALYEAKKAGKNRLVAAFAA